MSNKNKVLEECLIDESCSMEDAILNLESSGNQIAIVTSKDLQLKGVITDGDIRRAILKGLTLNCSVKKIMITEPVVVAENISNIDASILMKSKSIRHLPVVNSKNQVIDLHILDSIKSIGNLDNMFLIMAGGFGKRLAPYTNNCPKPMLEVNGKPMLEHIIEKAISEGFRNFIISIFYLPQIIKDYFEDGSRWGIKIKYLEESSPQGTAGALSMINPIPELPFIVTNGDVITKIKYAEILRFHREQNSHATMAVRRHELQNPFGTVLTDGLEIKDFEEKPKYVSNINAGIYVLSPEALNYLDDGKYCDMPTLFSRIAEAKKRTVVYPLHELWADIGRPEDLDLINKK